MDTERRAEAKLENDLRLQLWDWFASQSLLWVPTHNHLVGTQAYDTDQAHQPGRTHKEPPA
jgi:hypothetical protein